MQRQDVFKLIDAERNYQDTTYPETGTVGSGVTRLQRDKEVIGHILLLEEYALKARQAWVINSGSNKGALQQIAKAAAIAVRAIERVANSEELLAGGLR